jgi:hypothetical protein
MNKYPASRGFSAVISGERYQEPLLESIEQVFTCSKELMRQATSSHIAVMLETAGGVRRSERSK